MLITSAKMRDKVSIAKLHLLILFCVVFQEALQGSILCSLFLIFIKSNHIVSTVKQLAADLYYLSLVYARTLAGKLNPDLKANLQACQVSHILSDSHTFISKHAFMHAQSNVYHLSHIFQFQSRFLKLSLKIKKR